jgi:hypothetical protein
MEKAQSYYEPLTRFPARAVIFKRRLNLMIQKLMKALEGMDYKGLAACFSEKCRYFDYCPSLYGKENYFVYGSDSVEMFFRNRFVNGYLVVASTRVESDKSASFFASYGCSVPFVYARAEIKEFDENGLIRKLLVHPA